MKSRTRGHRTPSQWDGTRGTIPKASQKFVKLIIVYILFELFVIISIFVDSLFLIIIIIVIIALSIESKHLGIGQAKQAIKSNKMGMEYQMKGHLIH